MNRPNFAAAEKGSVPHIRLSVAGPFKDSLRGIAIPLHGDLASPAPDSADDSNGHT